MEQHTQEAVGELRGPVKPRWLGVFDTVLLVVAVALVAGRSRLQETIAAQAGWWVETGPDLGMAGPVAVLLFAGAFGGLMLAWLAAHGVERPLEWRPTSLGAGLGLLAVAAVPAVAVASNRYEALLWAATLLSGGVLALLLAQLLDTPRKRRLVLAAVAASGALMALRAWEQYHWELAETAEDFAADPERVLRRVGIEPGTYGARMYTARVESRDVGAYLGISNVAGAYFILALAAAAALLAGARPGRKKGLATALLWAAGLVVAHLVMMALMLTESKGAIVGFFAAGVIAPAIGIWRRRWARHWRGALLVAAGLVVAVIGAVAAWGMVHGRLPTNSLWVRWQYWQGALRMSLEHPLGVGPGNFGQYYARYAPMGAPELVQTPHCFVLALASQWGWLGLAGMVVLLVGAAVRLARPAPQVAPVAPAAAPLKEAALVPVRRHGRRSRAVEQAGTDRPAAAVRGGLPMWVYGIVIALAATLLHASASSLEGLGKVEWISVVAVAYVVPAFVWLAAFALFAALPWPGEAGDRGPAAVVIVLAAGLVGFLLHSSIDIALLQPATGTLFFVLLAVALSMRPAWRPGPVQVLGRWLRLALILAGALALGALVVGLLAPTIRSRGLLARAGELVDEARVIDAITPPGQRASSRPLVRQSYVELLSAGEAAAEIVPLDPFPAAVAGQAARRLWRMTRFDERQHEWFERAATNLERAVTRDRARGEYYADLRDLYLAGARQARNRGGDEARAEISELASRAFEYARQYLDRQPHNPEGLVAYARGLLTFGPVAGPEDYRKRAAEAIEHALAAEEALAAQLRSMYPQEEPFTRLPESQKNWARTELERLRSELE